MFLLEWEAEGNNVAGFSKALGFGVRCSSVHQILAWAVQSGQFLLVSVG